MSKSESSKYNILKAARKVFAEKGYDSTRVDEISREARINKAMLYYYFNSKENILREVIMNIFLTYKKDEISRFNINNLIDEGGLISDQDIESNMDMVLEYIKQNMNVFRIILTESLKAAPNDIIGFNVFDNILKRILKDVRGLGVEIDDENEFMVK